MTTMEAPVSPEAKFATACASTGMSRSRWMTGWCCAPTCFARSQEGRYPVILSYGPYAKGLAFQDGYPERMGTDGREASGRAARVDQQISELGSGRSRKNGCRTIMSVCVSIRAAAGRSPGYIDHFSPRETQDFYNCIEWAGGAPWSNGKVGLNGISYYGINQWQVASLQPPHLAAMCIWEGAADWYRDMTHHGGILSTFWANWYDMQVKTVQHGVGERGRRSRVHGELVCGPETLSERRTRRKPPSILAPQSAPTRSTTPTTGRARPIGRRSRCRSCPRPIGAARVCIRAAILRASCARPPSRNGWRRMAIEHWTHFYTDYGRELQKRFFDHFLNGEDTSWAKQPKVLLQVRHVDEFVERAENEWPLARTQWTKFYLDPADGALTHAPAEARRAQLRRLGDGAHLSSRRRCRPKPRSPARRRSSFRLVIDERRRSVPRSCGCSRRTSRKSSSRAPSTRIRRSRRAGCAPRTANSTSKLSAAYPPLPHARREAAAQARRSRGARYRDLADVDRRAGGISRRPQHSRQGLRIRRGKRRTAVEFQERAEGVRSVPAR